MKKKLLPLLIIAFYLSACSTGTTVEVTRHPLIKSTINAVSWKANNYFFIGPSQVVAYPANITQSGKLYNRFTLQAYGNDDKGANLQLNIVFDVSDISQLQGDYRSLYTSARGLSQVELYNLNNSNLAVYTLCANDTTSMLRIERQSPSEKLVSGTFQMMLCNVRDTTKKINITNGILTDVQY